jgi:hypothetical protein
MSHADPDHDISPHDFESNHERQELNKIAYHARADAELTANSTGMETRLGRKLTQDPMTAITAV